MTMKDDWRREQIKWEENGKQVREQDGENGKWVTAVTGPTMEDDEWR